MIVGTAGHIDHGKTSLVRALTGTDTDRLPEEKRRGISIELGYAFLDAPDGVRIGFVDVPGHERLVHTMLAGASGIDFALLVIAADDGVMPQTREHLAILSLLGLREGAVVISKIDRATPERVQAVQQQALALVADTPLASAPQLPISVPMNLGLDALREVLFAAARCAPRHSTEAGFRLGVDRVFSLDGVGTVATGSVHAGRVTLGEDLLVVPGGQRVRVRSLHAQQRSQSEAHAGQRAALGLVGVARDELHRGHWLVAPELACTTARLDLQLTLWHGESKPLRSGTPVHVHVGAATVVGSVALLESDSLAAGATALAQVLLRAPIGAWYGDRVVLRDAAASRTLAGGVVLDPQAPARHRRSPQRLAQLRARLLPDAQARWLAVLPLAEQGLDVDAWRAAQGLNRAHSLELPPDSLQGGDAQQTWVLHGAVVARARQRVLEIIEAFHAQHPDELGPETARLRRLALPRLPQPLWRALLARLRDEGLLLIRGAYAHRPAHGLDLSEAEERLAQTLAPALAAAGFEGAWVRDLARVASVPEPRVRVTLARVAQRGDLHQVVRDLYLPTATTDRLMRIVRELSAQQGEVTAARFRDATGLGRKRAIQILESFDRIGFLRRVADSHQLRRDSPLLSALEMPADDARARASQ